MFTSLFSWHESNKVWIYSFSFHNKRTFRKLYKRLASIADRKPSPTPVSLCSFKSNTDDQPYSDAQWYQSLVGSLQYITSQKSPMLLILLVKPCIIPLYRILLLLNISFDTFKAPNLIGLFSKSLSLYAYNDSDWAANPSDRRFTIGNSLYLVIIQLCGHRRNNNLWLNLPQMQSIKALAYTTMDVSWL